MTSGAPQAPGSLDRHFWLTQGMARTLGIRFSDVIAQGRLTPQGFTDLVNTCRGCPLSHRCVAWMARAEAATQPAPSYCENADALNRLRPTPRHKPPRVLDIAEAT